MNFAKELEARVERTNYVLRDFILPEPSQHTLLVEAMNYGALLGGKRLRPFLVYATGNMFGISDATLDAPAAAVECIHAYSLIHDDLPAMDNDNIRRGQPTCHMRFGEGNAILAGDALQALAFSILSAAPMAEVAHQDRLAMISELATASGMTGMCGGQALDLETRGRLVSLRKIEEIHRNKTGALIRAAVRLGALSAGERARDALPFLDQYAENIGLAFQVQDDILDIIEDTSILEKQHSVGQEIKKSTYPGILGLEKAQDKVQALINNAQQWLTLLTSLSLDTSSLEALANYIIERDK